MSLGVSITSISAQSQYAIPSWVKGKQYSGHTETLQMRNTKR